MKDLNVYINGLEKSLQEKLFFINQIDMSQFGLIVDFGCANGQMLRRIANLYTASDEKPVMIGYEPNAELCMVAEDSSSRYDISFVMHREDLEEYISKNTKKSLIIFSSVLHELDSEDKQKAIELMKKFDTVVIRDMAAPISFSEPIDTTRTRRRIVNRVPKYMIEDFEKIWGPIDNKKNMYHFFLKYTYVENWDTEVKEDYFSTPWSEIHEQLVLSEEYEIVYERSYTLEHKRKMVKKDFDHTMRDITHKMLILKRK